MHVSGNSGIGYNCIIPISHLTTSFNTGTIYFLRLSE